MATETVLDYLGHPCEIAKAKERFEEALTTARNLDVRELVRQIGGHLNALDDRGYQIGYAIDHAHESLLSCGDNTEGVCALLAMAGPYNYDSNEALFQLAGKVLAALERAQLVEVAHA